MVAAIFSLLIALGAIVAGAGYVQQAQAMRGFQSTPGKVIKREIAPIPGGGREGALGEGGGLMPKVTYRYSVGEKELTNDRLAYAYRGLKRSVAEQKLAAIPDQVTVWYDPNNPQNAYLERHTPTLGWALITGGAIVVIAAIAWMIAS